jgi:endonuclease/exonuclease/phosphatase family metal-dependent hydrolase
VRPTITLATWNLWWRFGDWRARRDLILESLRDGGADVIGLQEVWEAEGTNLGAWLADHLGFEHRFVPSPCPEKWQRQLGDNGVGIGNAVLSRWPIAHTASVRLPAGDAPDEGRTALHARVESPYGALPFFTTQLNSGWAQSAIRANQLAELGRFILALPAGNFPPAVGGDLNADPDFDEIRAFSGKAPPLTAGLDLLDSWWVLNPTDAGWTWDRANPTVRAIHEPSARIDYLFVGRPRDGRGEMLTARLFGAEPRDGVWPSDHFGVQLTITAGNPRPVAATAER